MFISCVLAWWVVVFENADRDCIALRHHQTEGGFALRPHAPASRGPKGWRFRDTMPAEKIPGDGVSDHRFSVGLRPHLTAAAGVAACSRSCSFYRLRGATTNIGSKVLTSHMIESSRKVNSIGRDRAWHSTTTLRPSCLYPNARVLVADARQQLIDASPQPRRRSALQSRNSPPSEHWALGCMSEMSASIATRFVGYTRAVIIR